MWSRRAQEYESKISSGKIYELAEVVRDLNDQALKCLISEFESERMRSKISPGNSLYKTFIPKGKNECTVYRSFPKNFNSGFKSILFWNRNLDATWFQIEIDQTTGETLKICGDSSKQGCDEENSW